MTNIQTFNLLNSSYVLVYLTPVSLLLCSSFSVQGGKDLQKQEEEAEEETEAAGGAAGETDARDRSSGERGGEEGGESFG